MKVNRGWQTRKAHISRYLAVRCIAWLDDSITELHAIHQLVGWRISDLPTGKAAENAATCATAADIKPTNVSIAVVVDRETNTNVCIVRATFDALPMFWAGTSPELFAVADEVLARTARARPLGHAFVVVRVEVKSLRATGTFREPKVVNLVILGGVRLKKRANVARLRANPPPA